MDKEQTRILILVLTGILFFGQAVYDYFKKHRRRNPRGSRSTSTVHTRRHAVSARPVQQVKTAPKPVSATHATTNAVPAHTDPGIPTLSMQPHTAADTSSLDVASSAEQPSELSATCRQSEDISREELRRAVIWSEILKRKF